MTEVKVKRGRGRPKGSKNKVKTTNVVVAKRGRGRPKGSKNKSTISLEPDLDEVMDIPHPNPKHEWERIDNIRHIASFYQHPDGRKKTVITPKKRGRKSALENFDPEKLLKEDLDSDKLVYSDDDVRDELGRMDAYKDMSANRNRYSEDF